MKNKYGVLIWSVWAVLISYCIIKVFGGNYFELVTTSNSFIAVCNFIDEHIAFRKILFAILSALSGYFVISSIMKKKLLNWWMSLLFVALMLTKSILQWDFKILGYILDFVIVIFLPMIFMKDHKLKSRILRPIIGYGLIFIFQILSMFIANLALFKFTALNSLSQLLYSLEYYFCIALYYLYSNKKRKEE